VSLWAQDGSAPWELAEPAPVPDGRAAVLDRLEELSCAECHREVVDEWASTAHALAWVDELYQDALEDRRKPQTCHACHVPAPLHGEELAVRPKAREELRHFGVSCEACHLGPHGEMLGPRGLEPDGSDGEPAHTSARSETMVGPGSNELCAACHRTTVGPVIGVAKDFELTDQEGHGRTCVGCHMRPYAREDGTVGRSHRLQTPRDPAFLRRAFELSIEVAGRETVVVVANRAGHRVPGLVGRDLTFAVELLDEAGDVLAEERLELTTRAFLPADGDVRIALAATGARVRVRAEHADPRLAEPVRFLEEEFVP
jgi:hypothetical protein